MGPIRTCTRRRIAMANAPEPAPFDSGRTCMKPFFLSRDPHHWHAAFRLLSLDCALPIWEQMGLDLGKDDQLFVQHAARIAYLILQDGSRNYFGANYSNAKKSAKLFFSILKTYGGKAFERKISTWCKNGFVRGHGEISPEEAWGALFIRLSSETPKLIYPLDLPESKFELLKKRIIPLAQFHEQLKTFIESNTVGQKTEWDKSIYENSFAPEGEEKMEGDHTFYALLNASDTITKRVADKLVFEIFEDLEKEFAEEEMRKLFNWYQCEIRPLVETFPGLETVPEKGRKAQVGTR
jgi:hypothetical protein